jgi:hypothetical protein
LNADDARTLFRENVCLAHQALFHHRHADATPEFHWEMIRLWHSPNPKVGVMAFREGGKSTIAEEAFCLGAAFGWFRNGIILGSSLDRANDRMRAVKHEIENNENFVSLFGELKGEVWNESRIVLTNGVIIQSFGRGQSLRGVKHLQWRPDFCFADDIEEPEHVRTPEARRETLAWFMSVVLPALDKDARIRINATPLDRDALPVRLMKEPGWQWRTFPIEYPDPKTSRRTPTWPARYNLSWIDRRKQELERLGLHDEFMREYMCEAEDIARKTFTSDIFKVRTRVRTWETAYAFIDPARTTTATSATTGWAVWSWINNRLVVWDAGAGLLKPDEIVNKVFELDDLYRPAILGVEQDGLEDFLLQPIRHEQLRRGIFVPVRGVRAPKGKLGFIEALQPLFLHQGATFAKELPDLVYQFLSFPTGKIDAPNALAYCKHPELFPGMLVYDNFGSANVVDDLPVRPRDPRWLAINAAGGVVTGILCQLNDGVLYVLHDYVLEGEPSRVVHSLVQQAKLDANADLRLVAPVGHFSEYNILGLRGAVANLPADLRSGASVEVGRSELRGLLQRTARDRPCFLVSTRARWTLNALASGYAFAVDKRGTLSEEPRTGLYRTLMEGLEAFAGLTNISMVEAPTNIRVTDQGVAYVSTLPNRPSSAPTKLAAVRADDLVNDARRLVLRR